MASMVLIASEASIARCGEQLKKELPPSGKLVIAEYYMEEAVRYARQDLPEDTDVIMARGNTARLLKAARLPVPVVTIPITDAELIRSVEKAKSIYGTEDSSIAYIGIEDSVRSVSAFLSLLHRSIRFYPVKSSQDIEANIRQAKRDKVNVVIGGVYTKELAQKAGLDCVLIETAYPSLRDAYERALEVQRGTMLQKRRILEQATILNSISDGLISVNEKGSVTMANPQAEAMLHVTPGTMAGSSCFSFLSKTASALVNRALLSGREILGHQEKLSGREGFLMDLRPLSVNGKSRGLLITLRKPSGAAFSELPRQPDLPSRPSCLKFSDLAGSAPCFREAVSAALLCAPLPDPVLLTGQPGTGRSALAQCIHGESGRQEPLFFSVSAALLREEDFLAAHQGTLFIRDLERISPPMAAVLEDFLETGVIFTEDGTVCAADTRILAASSRPLEDVLPPRLYYRLHALTVALPPLDKRREDLPALAASFVRRFGELYKKNCRFSPEALAFLEKAPMPGGLLYLEALCRRLVCFCPSHGELREDLTRLFAQKPSGSWDERTPSSAAAAILPKSILLGGRSVTLAQLRLLEQACHGRRALMAEKLGVSRSTLWRGMKELEEMETNHKEIEVEV